MTVAGLGLLVLGTFAISAAMAGPLRSWLQERQVLDLPESRRSHARPTPRGGGLAVVTALLLAWLAWPGSWQAWSVPLTAVFAMALVGWLEDRYGLRARWRFIAQVAVAVGMLAAIGGIGPVVVIGLVIEQPLVLGGLAVLAVVWLINLYNFMDGADGLAALQGVWAGLVLSAFLADGGEWSLAALSLAGAGAWGGFLLWNRPPASMFMGDVGSLALGSFVAALALLGKAGGSVALPISFMVSSVFVVDATLTLLRRVIRRERWYTAHRQHAYQRLLVMGWSHGRVLALYALVNVLVVLPVIAAAWRWPSAATWLAAGLAALLAAGWQVVQSAATRHNDKASL